MEARAFVHLHTHSAFSFGEGPSPIAALVLRAAELRMPSLALTDTNSVTGVPELFRRCQRVDIAPIGGCEVILEGGSRLTLLADGPTGFSSLCQILSTAGLRDVQREGLRVRFEDIQAFPEGLVCLTGAPPYGLLPRLLLARRSQEAHSFLQKLYRLFGPDRLFVEVVRSLGEGEATLSRHLLNIADSAAIPAVATNAACYATKAEFPAHEALLRVRLGVPVGEEHGDLPFNGERYLKDAAAMATLFSDRPDVILNAVRLAELLAPPLDPVARHYPRYPHLPHGESAFSYLSALVWQGARQRGIQDTPRLIHELETIRDLDYCDYFLICRQVVLEAQRRGIGCALRGSAIGSAALFALGVSDHDPIARRVSFERFLSRARRKPPDIDIDFRHDRRDEMQAWLRATFGQDRVAVVCNYVTYRGRSLLRDLGKALGFDSPEIDRLRELLWHSNGDDLVERLQALPELRALGIDPAVYTDLFALCAQLSRNPRHLGTHSSGIVVSDVPIAQVAPVLWAGKGVPLVACDKDDVESPGIGLLKMDQLCLRALTAIEITKGTLPPGTYEGRDREDADTLAMIRAAQTVGVFQVESPAQMALQWRLKAEKFDDLVHAVALVRPGPLVGGGIAPYLSVRHGHSRPVYPIPELASVLDETYGRILFQDQVLDVVRIVGGFEADAGAADAYLKAMTHARNQEEMTALGLELWGRARERGMARRAFGKLWRQIQGFSRYGFCHGHSVAFAAHAQGTAWLLRHYPATFLAAVLSVEPCGFWPVATVVEEARRRGVRVLGPCLNQSDATLWKVETTSRENEGKEAAEAIRCPLGFVKEVTHELAQWIVHQRNRDGVYRDLPDAGRRLGIVPRESLEWLVLSGALDCLLSSRRRMLWSLPAIHRAGGTKRPVDQHVGQIAAELETPPLLPPTLPDFAPSQRESLEWQALGFSPSGHPLRRFRAMLQAQGILPCAMLQDCSDGDNVSIAGLSLRPHRPPVPSGEIVVFLTLEDETGLAQVTVPEAVYQKYGSTLLGCWGLVIVGRATVRGAGAILIADAAIPLKKPWRQVALQKRQRW